MVPIRDKAAAATAPVALQGEIEARAPEPAEAVGRACGGSDLPAGHGGGRQRIAVMPQQQAEPAAGLGCQCEAARGGEIGGFACLRQLGQNRREGPAFEPLFEAPKRIAGMCDPQEQESLERQAKKLEPDPIGRAAFAGRKLGRDAEHLPFGCREPRERQRKPEGRTEMQLACGRKLMQSPDRKAPLERRIEGGHAQPEQALFGAQGGNGGNPAGQGKNPGPIACGRGSSTPFRWEEKGGAGARTGEGCGHFLQPVMFMFCSY